MQCWLEGHQHRSRTAIDLTQSPEELQISLGLHAKDSDQLTTTAWVLSATYLFSHRVRFISNPSESIFAISGACGTVSKALRK